MTALALRLFSSVRLTVDNEPSHIGRRKAVAWFAYLTAGEPQLLAYPREFSSFSPMSNAPIHLPLS
ncbi:MAG TPA: hypothetical protein P5121_05755, partial [Caldilineaceae bacterium]|nr:hypothetical protein [Caldilineaceae bacterium]